MLAVNDRGGIILDRTVFYATGGGQPGDAGRLLRADGSSIAIATAVYGDDKSVVVHVPAEGEPLPAPGETVRIALDWERRHRHMRIHTGLHLLSVVLPFPVTGGAIGAEEGRLDFDLDGGEVPPKEEVEERLNQALAKDPTDTSRILVSVGLFDRALDRKIQKNVMPETKPAWYELPAAHG